MACVANKEKSKKYGDFDYFDYSIKTWEYWCERNGCEFVEFTKQHSVLDWIDVNDIHDYI